MREILFRGKRIDNEEWVEGYLCKSVRHLETSHQNVVVDTIEVYDGESYLNIVFRNVSANSIGQFTAMTDKNGKRIFEGDIGRYKQTDGAKRNGNPIICTGKVIYNAKTASYAVESKDEAGCKYFDYFPIKDFEVIGNIHDNPELLEVC